MELYDVLNKVFDSALVGVVSSDSTARALQEQIDRAKLVYGCSMEQYACWLSTAWITPHKLWEKIDAVFHDFLYTEDEESSSVSRVIVFLGVISRALVLSVNTRGCHFVDPISRVCLWYDVFHGIR